MNKKQKTQKCQDILYKYNLNTPIEDDNLYFLISIFENHPNWDIKKGTGIKTITIIKTMYNNKCFQINRTDSTSTDISFTAAISKPSKISDIQRACRKAIRNEIVTFRYNNVVYGKSTCPYTNEVLTKDNTHIHHYDLSFKEMFDKWIENKNVDEIFKLVNETEDNSFETYFTDKEFENNFIQFHNSTCKLAVVSKKANLSIL